MLNSQIAQSSGILNPQTGATRFQLSRYCPAPELAFFVQNYWIVSWDLRGQPPYLQENLPYPCVNLVFDQAQTAIFGVVSGKFGYLLQEQGRVFGIKFRPGGFYPFVKRPLSGFTDATLSLEEVFGVDSRSLETAILGQAAEAAMVALAEDFLRAGLPAQDETVTLVNRLVDAIIAERRITRVDELAGRFGLSRRHLQRLFSQYVGVSPKWVIQRYRLQEAADQLANGAALDWPRLALELGYFDQAHFIKDFKSLVGRTPADYARH